jgi:ubiquinone/menaquinone biosynthesis C-methylase UbiE
MNFWKNQRQNIYTQHYNDMAHSLKTKQEIEFFSQIFHPKQPIIEFGCGSGRTLIPLLKKGFQIQGLDISEAMLQQTKEKLKKENVDTKLYHKDLTDFTINSKFEGAILSQRTLNFITEPQRQKKALENIAQILKKDATLVINLMPARPDDFAQSQKTFKKTGSFENTETKKTVEIWQQWIPHPMEQLWEMTDEFREASQKKSVTMTMRIIFENEMKNLLEVCGFQTLNIYGNWDKKPYTEKATDLIFVAKRV